MTRYQCRACGSRIHWSRDSNGWVTFDFAQSRRGERYVYNDGKFIRARWWFKGWRRHRCAS